MADRNFVQGYDDKSPDRMFMTILPDFIGDMEKAHLRNRPLTALMQQYGSFVYNCGGNGFDWAIYAHKHTLRTYSATARRTFVQHDPIERARLTWSGYEVTDVMSERERRIARQSGPMALTNFYDEFGNSMRISAEDQLGPQHFINGYDPANLEKWKGLKSLFQTSGDSISIVDGTARTAHQDDILLEPEGVYAALQLQLGYYGGSAPAGAVWPDGEADSSYDFYTPLIVIGNSHYFNAGGSTHTWKDQGEEVLSWTLMQLQRNRTEYSRYVILMGRGWYEQFKAAQRAKQQIWIGPSDEMKELGFGPRTFTMSDGVEVILEYSLDSQEAIIVDLSCCELRSLFPDILTIPETAPWYDEDNDRWKFAISNLSQWKYHSPRNFAHIVHVETLDDAS